MSLPRVLRIFSRYQRYGGEEAVVRQISAALSSYQHADLFESSSDEQLGGSLINRIQAPAKMIHNAGVARSLNQLQKKNRYQVWEIHNVFPALSPAVYQAGWAAGVPILHYLHNYRSSCVNGSFVNHGQPCHRCLDGNFWPAFRTVCWRSSRLACAAGGLTLARVRRLDVFHRVTAWIAISELQKRWHTRMGIPENRISVVPHFYDDDVAPSTGVPRDGYVLYLGRLDPEKGVNELLKAWKAMGSLDETKLVVAGTGPEQARLQEFVTVHRLRVEFRGFVRREDQAALWAGTKLLVVPSIWDEPFGRVVLEAWANRRPVLVSSQGALPEIVADPQFTFDPRDTTEFADGMKRLLTNHEMLTAQAASGNYRLRTYYQRSRWLDDVNQVYSDLGYPFL